MTGGVLPAVSASPALAGVTPTVDPLTTPCVTPVFEPLAWPTAPEPWCPANDSSESVALPKVVLTWKPVVGATQYRVQISANEDWTNNRVGDAQDPTFLTVGSTFEVPPSLPSGSYFWRVRAEKPPAGTATAPGSTSWSTVRTFYRSWNAAPGFPAVTATQPAAEFRWSPVAHASGYVLEVAPDDGLTTWDQTYDILSCFTNHTAYSPYDYDTGRPEAMASGPAHGCFTLAQLKSMNNTNGVWKWRVRAVDETSNPLIVADSSSPSAACTNVNWNCGVYWSATRTTTFAIPAAMPAPTAAPGAITVACATSGTSCTDTPTLSWPPVANAQRYRVQLALDDDFDNVHRSYVTSSNGVTPRDSLFDNQAGLSYHVRVQACDAGSLVVIESIS
ncbi:MAG: Fibronectin type domain protein, partial [Frankiales bacterium]|nr:Fibronectin type domain protein [Frankiales bacterium]